MSSNLKYKKKNILESNLPKSELKQENSSFFNQNDFYEDVNPLIEVERFGEEDSLNMFDIPLDPNQITSSHFNLRYNKPMSQKKQSNNDLAYRA